MLRLSCPLAINFFPAGEFNARFQCSAETCGYLMPVAPSEGSVGGSNCPLTPRANAIIGTRPKTEPLLAPLRWLPMGLTSGFHLTAGGSSNSTGTSERALRVLLSLEGLSHQGVNLLIYSSTRGSQRCGIRERTPLSMSQPRHCMNNAQTAVVPVRIALMWRPLSLSLSRLICNIYVYSIHV